MKTVIWIIGSNSAGKTTLARKFHDHLSSKPKQIIRGVEEGINYCYTSFGDVCHVGAINDNQCTGTDTLGKKENVECSFLMCLLDESSKYIILDPIMSTGKYVSMLHQFDCKVILIYLHFDHEIDNFRRVQIRRQNKTGKTGELAEKTKDNLRRKMKIFSNLYEKAKLHCFKSVKIDANLSSKEIFAKSKKLL